jgi:hypothetical protein
MRGPLAGLLGLLGLLALAAAPASAHTMGIESYFGAGDIAYSGQVVYFDGQDTRSGAMARRPGQQAVRYNIAGVRYFGLLDDAAGEAVVYADGEIVQRLAYDDPDIDRVAPQLAFHGLVHRREVGQETVNGVATTRYVLTGFTRNDFPYAAEVWFSSEGAVIRVRGTVLNAPIRYDLYGFRVGEPPEADFALQPSDQP